VETKMAAFKIDRDSKPRLPQECCAFSLRHNEPHQIFIESAASPIALPAFERLKCDDCDPLTSST